MHIYADRSCGALLLLRCYREDEVYDNVGNRIIEPDGVATSFIVLGTLEEVESVNLVAVYGKVQIYLKTE